MKKRKKDSRAFNERFKPFISTKKLSLPKWRWKIFVFFFNCDPTKVSGSRLELFLFYYVHQILDLENVAHTNMWETKGKKTKTKQSHWDGE